MRIEILDIVERGVPNKECLVLKVIAECDLSYFIVLDTVYLTPNSISSSNKNSYWFKPKKVKSGDYILLYSGIGKDSESNNTDGSVNHVMCWGKSNTLWNKEGDCAVLFEISSWQTTKYK